MLIAVNVLLDLAMVLQVLAVLAFDSLPAFASFWFVYPMSVVVVIITKYRRAEVRVHHAAAFTASCSSRFLCAHAITFAADLVFQLNGCAC